MKNPQAFPTHPDGALINDGMTLRDYFASKVLQAVMSSVEMGIIFSKGDKPPTDEISESCYAMADAMLKAREV